MRSRAGIGFLILVEFLFSAATGHASPRVQTRDHLAFELPAGYRVAPELLDARELPRAPELAFSQQAAERPSQPVHVLVFRIPELATARVPEAAAARDPASTEALSPARIFAEGVQRALGLRTADISARGYDAEHGAVWATFTQRSASRARAFLDLRADDPVFSAATVSGLTSAAARCLLGQTLSAASSVEQAALPSRLHAAATHCGVAPEVASTYAQELGGSTFFAPFEATFTTIGYFTTTALVLVVAGTESSSAQQLASLVRHVYRTASIASDAQPLGTGPDHVKRSQAGFLGRIIGALAGSLAGVALFGLLLSVALHRLGWTAARASAVALASLLAVVAASPLIARTLNDTTITQLLVYSLGGALLYPRLRRWLESDGRGGSGGSKLASDASGLSTLEYAVLFVVICVGCLAVWTHLQASLSRHIIAGEGKVDAAFERATTSAPRGSSPSQTPASTSSTTPQSWAERLVQGRPIATTLVKEAAVIALETAVPVVGVINAARTLHDEHASGWEKGLAAAQIAASVVPPIAAGIKIARRGAQVAAAAGDVAKVAQTAEAAADTVRAAKVANEAAEVAKATHTAAETAHIAKVVERSGDAAQTGAVFGNRSVGAAERVWTKSARMNAAQLPHRGGKVRYVPPKNWHASEPLPRGPNHGYLDGFGNEWTKGPSRTSGEPFEWDVQLREGGHWNVSLEGHITH